VRRWYEIEAERPWFTVKGIVVYGRMDGGCRRHVAKEGMVQDLGGITMIRGRDRDEDAEKARERVFVSAYT
jgi:hypothetical protein